MKALRNYLNKIKPNLRKVVSCMLLDLFLMVLKHFYMFQIRHLKMEL